MAQRTAWICSTEVTPEKQNAELRRETRVLKARLMHSQQESKQLGHDKHRLEELYQQIVAEKNQVETEKRDHLKFLKTLIEAIPAPIFYKDKKGFYLGCNRPTRSTPGSPETCRSANQFLRYGPRILPQFITRPTPT
jgi:PAS domain-containing protein